VLLEVDVDEMESRVSANHAMFERALRHSRSARPVNISRFYVATKFRVALQDAYAYENFVGGVLAVSIRFCITSYER
jgi:hypothetical protein